MYKEIEKLLNKISLHSERLSITKFSQEDIEYNVKHEMQEELMQYIKEIESEEKIRANTQKCAQDWEAIENKWLLIALRLKDNNEYIGILCLRYLCLKDRLVEIGWRLGSEFHGKGYALEATKRFLKFAKEELKVHKVLANIDSRNLASIKLAQKLGFEKEAHLKKHFSLNGKWCDEIIYASVFDD